MWETVTSFGKWTILFWTSCSILYILSWSTTTIWLFLFAIVMASLRLSSARELCTTCLLYTCSRVSFYNSNLRPLQYQSMTSIPLLLMLQTCSSLPRGDKERQTLTISTAFSFFYDHQIDVDKSNADLDTLIYYIYSKTTLTVTCSWLFILCRRCILTESFPLIMLHHSLLAHSLFRCVINYLSANW